MKVVVLLRLYDAVQIVLSNFSHPIDSITCDRLETTSSVKKKIHSKNSNEKGKLSVFTTVEFLPLQKL